MRFYFVKKCFRCKRILAVVIILTVISTGIRMRGFFRNGEDEVPLVTIKKLEVFKYELEKFSVGSFLKRRSPGNMTFCNFRLGDSDSFNYTDRDVAYSPELGDKSPYRVLYEVVKGLQFNSSETNTVTYATHVTLGYLFHVVEIVTRWGGPVSVGCFLPGTDAVLALKILEKMCFCVREMENVNIHFIYHKDHPPKQMSFKNYSLWLDMEEEDLPPWKTVSADFPENVSSGLPQKKDNNTVSRGLSGSCYVPLKIFESSYRNKHSLVYPINVARNVARYGSRSKYVLVSDIELLPSDNMVEEFLKMIQRLKDKNKSLGDHYFTKKKSGIRRRQSARLSHVLIAAIGRQKGVESVCRASMCKQVAEKLTPTRHVFVVPVFEVSGSERDVPRTKSQLLDLYDRDRAVYFHRFVCVHCQRFPGIQRWLQSKPHPRTKSGVVQPLLVVKREFPYHRWEPVYIGTNEEPLYSEMLTWEGQQDKMTQMHEMCLLEYRFVILNGAFLVHVPGIKHRKPKQFDAVPKTRPGRDNKTNSLTATAKAEVFRTWLDSHIRRNSYLYQIITQDVMSRYRYNPRCRIH